MGAGMKSKLFQSQCGPGIKQLQACKEGSVLVSAQCSRNRSCAHGTETLTQVLCFQRASKREEQKNARQASPRLSDGKKTAAGEECDTQSDKSSYLDAAQLEKMLTCQQDVEIKSVGRQTEDPIQTVGLTQLCQRLFAAAHLN
ncbi:unnamed protein product [Pleuronectes platessa]|uniref:Uncharacterized protein n=1 Tax=Pleuronectes platessa TaxID=8262 RepID=A0A9N7VWC4_PLEPL|nr:unnamed protein product [Pleuronectes platessa]